MMSQTLGFRVTKSVGPVCRPGCFCICHSVRKSDTSGYFERIIGRLFVGYSGLPLLNSRCDSVRCRRSQTPNVSAEYWFPLGFCWSQMICLELGFQPNIGPQWELSTLRRVPDSAQCVKYALGGDIEGLKGLFQQGMASPKDVSSTRGYSLLRVSRHLWLQPKAGAKHRHSGLSMANNMRLVDSYLLRARTRTTSKLIPDSETTNCTN